MFLTRGLGLFSAVMLLASTLARAAESPAPAVPLLITADGMAIPVPEVVVPSYDSENIKLDAFLDYLQGQVPGFKTIVVRDRGVPDDYPMLHLKLRQTSIAQIILLLQHGYGLEMEQLDAPAGPLYLFRVHHPEGAAGPVKIYPLSEPVAAIVGARSEPMKDAAAANKDALEQIVSVLKQAMKQVPDAPPEAVLEIHEPTQTLIFKGNAAQQAVVDGAIAAFPGKHSIEEKRLIELRSKFERLERELALQAVAHEEKADRLNQEIAAMRKSLDESQKAYLQQVAEAERLKVRLEETEKQRLEKGGAKP